MNGTVAPEAFLALYTYHGSQTRELPFGPCGPEETFAQALAGLGFDAAPLLQWAPAAAGIGVAVYIARGAAPPEYVAAVTFPGDGPEDWPQTLYLPDWPSLVACLREVLAPLRALPPDVRGASGPAAVAPFGTDVDSTGATG